MLGYPTGFGPIVALVLIWSLYWKGMALWKAARAENKNWFIALLVINTFGILEIFYIYYISKDNEVVVVEKEEDSK